jgi:hypothetical protein
MPQIVPAGYARVVHSLELVGDAEPMAITYGVGPIDLADDPQAVVTGLHNAFGTHLAPRVSNQYVLAQTELLYQFASLPSDPVVYLASTPIACTQENMALPQNSATLVHKRTSLGGARGRGRLYVPGVPEGEVSPTGILVAAWRTTLGASFTSFLAAIEAAIPGPNTGMVLLHQSVGTPPPGFPPPTIVTALTVDPRIATQRRRLRK